ncbi:MAG: hypothetical protein GX897_04485 [Clostridiales bacterium]|nr:hypothetical protein [Clostridiales bacterium]
MFPTNHDLHCHSFLSSCSNNPLMTTQAILDYAEQNGYDLVAVTDHLWDASVPGASDWYQPQDIAHISRSLPLPKSDKVKFLFGCETEYCGGEKLGLSKENFDLFDIVIIPTDHFWMPNFVNPPELKTTAEFYALQIERFEELSRLDIPWRKVGLAHPHIYVPDGVDDPEFEKVYTELEDRAFEIYKKLAALGCGIEINCDLFAKDGKLPWLTKIFKVMKEAGCKFFCCSDAHGPESLDLVKKYGPRAAEQIGLTAADRWVPIGF